MSHEVTFPNTSRLCVKPLLVGGSPLCPFPLPASTLARVVRMAAKLHFAAPLALGRAYACIIIGTKGSRVPLLVHRGNL